MRIEDLDTPVLLVDLDALEENLDRYQRYFDTHGIVLRPHIKTHKTLASAHMQMARGAIGIACQKLGEAEVMAAGGVDSDILIPYNIIGNKKLDRLTALARQTKLTVTADSAYTVNGLSEAAAADGVTVGVVVELDRGRTGVASPQQAVDLGRRILALPGLELRGIMIMPSPPDVRPLIQETLDLFDRAGLPHPIVSGGSTAYAFTAHEIPELTEYRAGEYPVGGDGHLWDGRAILDAGIKTMSAVMRGGAEGPSLGHVVEYPEAHFQGASEEHGNLDVSACERKPGIGERPQVLPVHPCPCVNEHNEMVAIRKGWVETVWPILARGKIR